MIFKLDFGKKGSCTVTTMDPPDEGGYVQSVVWDPRKPRMTKLMLAQYKEWFNDVNKKIADQYECVIVHIYHTDGAPQAYIFVPNEEPKLATKEELIKWINP